MAEEPNKPTGRPERIGKYEILDHIASGGMGVIYKARDVDLDRLVALKLLPADMANQEITLARFYREARAAARLRHDNIVAIFDVGSSNGNHFIALEYVDGTDLQDYISRKGRLDPEEARQILIQATRALAHAHEEGIVHRDIKPSNFLLFTKGNRLVVKLNDFGLAIRNEDDAEFRITRDKTTVGTVDYMSPEQARDSRLADIRSDIYSLGCTFFHMLAGQAPFARGTMPERLVQHMRSSPPDVRRFNKKAPDYFVVIIHRMLAKKPEDRYQTPAELLHDLEHPEAVAELAKRVPAVGKLERPTTRKPTVEPKEEFEIPEPDEESTMLKPLKIEDENKIPVKPARKSVEAIKLAVKTRPIKEPPPLKDEDVPDDIEDEPPAKATDRPAPERTKKKAPASSPMWMYAIGGTVGVLCLVLIISMLFGDKPRPQKKDTARTTDVSKSNVPEHRDPTPPEVVASPADKMTVATLPLPTIVSLPSDADQAKLHVQKLRKEYYGPFTSFPSAPANATVFRLSRLASVGPTTFCFLENALAQTKPGEFTVIEIHDNGPIYMPSLPALADREILIRAGKGYRPVLVWDAPKKPLDKTRATTFFSLGQGNLILENLDFVLKASEEVSATWFDLPDSEFYARDCTFSVGGKARDAVALVQRGAGSPDKTKTWLQRCYVRGSDISLLRLHQASSSVMLEDSLIVGYEYPIFQVRERDEDALALHGVRSTVVCGNTLLRWRTQDGKPGSPRLQVSLLDSILSRDDDAPSPGDMVQLADGSDTLGMKWQAVNSAYAGWNYLLMSGSKKIGGAEEEAWQTQWVSREDRVIALPWPKNPPAGLEEQSANTFVPGHAPVAFAALTREGAIGCVAGWLPSPPQHWIERYLEPTPTPPVIPIADAKPPDVPSVGDGLFTGGMLDLNKMRDKDLGVFLTEKLKNTGPKVVLRLTGAGSYETSPIRLKGVQHLTLSFEGDPQNPVTLKAKSERVPVIEMNGGHLELIGARIELMPTTSIPTVVQVQDGNLTMTNCSLVGPLTKTAVGFESLIAVKNSSAKPATVLLRDNWFVSGTLLVQINDNVQVKARNNVFLSFGDGMRFDANVPSPTATHILDHNTWAVQGAFIQVRTGAGFEAVGPVVLHANSNAFLHPFSSDADAGTLLRGADGWVSTGRWTWQGRHNVFDSRLHAYFAGNENAGAAQSLAEWKKVWGPLGEQEAMLFTPAASAKTISIDGGNFLSRWFVDRLTLPPSIRGDFNQTPPGASFNTKKK